MKRERIEEIAELLDKRGKLTLEQLEEYFPNVSQMTLRRDLFQLEEEGKIIRVRGGAMSVKEVQKRSPKRRPCWWTRARPSLSTAAPRRCISPKSFPI